MKSYCFYLCSFIKIKTLENVNICYLQVIINKNQEYDQDLHLQQLIKQLQ